MDDATRTQLGAVAAAHPALRLLVLHGSRARGDAHAASDWDFAFLADRELDLLGLAADLGDALGTERVDLGDLARAGGLYRHRVATDGVPLFERAPGAFVEFATAAALFWCDVEPVLRRSYAAYLEALP